MISNHDGFPTWGAVNSLHSPIPAPWPPRCFSVTGSVPQCLHWAVTAGVGKLIESSISLWGSVLSFGSILYRYTVV